MLGYTKEDLDDMSMSIHSILHTVQNQELYENLSKATDFLDGLWAEGYFD